MAGGASSEPQQRRKTPKKEPHVFTVGSAVEVLTEEQDYGGVFFTATVVESTPSSRKGGRKNSKNDKVCVEYHDLVVEEGASEHLREFVDVTLVRPEPPERGGGCFEVGQLVDAFYNDGWWTGVVTQLVEEGGGRREDRRVIVTFPHPPDVREFAAPELRPHLKWVDGAWIMPEKQDVAVLSSIGIHLHDQSLKLSESMSLNLMNNHQSEELTHVSQKTSHVANGVTKRRHSPEPIASSLPLKRVKEGGGLFGARQQVQIDRMLKEMVSDIRTEYQLSNNLSLWKPITKRRSNIGAAQTVGGKRNRACENIEEMVQPLKLEVVIGGKNLPSQVVEDKLERNVSAKAVIVGLPVTDSVSFASGKSTVDEACASGSILANNLPGDSTTQKKNGRLLESHSMKLRRKGKPRKCVQPPMNGNSETGDPNQKSTDKDGETCPVSEKVVTVIDDVSPNQETTALDGDKFLKDRSGPCYQTTEKIPAETRDENSDEETLLAALRRRRLSKSRKVSPQVPGSNLGTPKEKCMEENGKAQRNGESLQEDKLENNQQPSASASNDEASALPFVKNNDLWKTIESMEAFKKIPQKPHFTPLQNFPERSRQGLAIGLMVTCASIMEEALNLRLGDPKTATDSLLETVLDLETHGFDVKAVKDRISNFIAIRDKHHNYLEEAKRLKERILESEDTRRKNGEEGCMIKEQIRKLQERLVLVESLDAKASDEIIFLKAKLRETEKEINDAGRDFEGSNTW